jgi:hypothetical protein
MSDDLAPLFLLEGRDGSAFGTTGTVHYMHPITYPEVYNLHVLVKPSFREKVSSVIAITQLP